MSGGMGRIETQVVEGVHADESLMIVSGDFASFVIVKGSHDNIAIELDEHGWHALATYALEQSVRAEVPEAYDEGRPLTTAWIRKALGAQGMSVRDMAVALKVDPSGMVDAFFDVALLPVSVVRRIAELLDLPMIGLDTALRMDRRRFPELREATFAFGVGHVNGKRTNLPKRWERKERT